MLAAIIFSASTSKPESISSKIANFGRSANAWRTSLRFFSPPERSRLTVRLRKLSSNPTRGIASFKPARTSIAAVPFFAVLMRLKTVAPALPLDHADAEAHELDLARGVDAGERFR